MMKNVRRTKAFQGSIALTTVIILFAMLSIAGIALIFSTVDISLATKGSLNYELAEVASINCVQEALYKLTANKNFTGTVNLTLPSGATCSVVVTVNAGDGNLRDIAISGANQGYNFTRSLRVNVSVNPFTVSSV